MFPIDLLRRRERRERAGPPDHRAILLVVPHGQRRVVAACCERAMLSGVCPGMPVGDAGALLPVGETRVEPFTPERDRGALRALAAWAQRFSPIVAVDTPPHPDGLLLDVTGCERVFRGEHRLLRTVLGDLARLGFRARAAIAPTFGCAWAVARYGAERGSIVPEGGARLALGPLPIRSLRVDLETEAGLREVGIERVEHLLGLPRSGLPARFGHEILLRLDRALGHAMEAIEPVRPSAPCRVERIFDGPATEWEAIAMTVRELLGQLVDLLRARESGAARIDIGLVRSDFPPVWLTLSLSRPSRDARHLWSLVRPRLERVNLGLGWADGGDGGGIEGIEIIASRTRRLAHAQIERWQSSLSSGPSGEEPLSQLIDTLANRLGRDRVRVGCLVESHVPERAVGTSSAMDGVGNFRETSASAPGDRPSLLFEHSAPAEVIALTPDGPVHRVRWRGGVHVITTSIGPERIAPEWWRTDGCREATRDYFKVQEAGGRWLWLYHELETGRWFVHGVWA